MNWKVFLEALSEKEYNDLYNEFQSRRYVPVVQQTHEEMLAIHKVNDEEKGIYLRDGTIAAIKAVRTRLNCGLLLGKELVERDCGPMRGSSSFAPRRFALYDDDPTKDGL
jgi:ribosomal protein L7/L12